MYFQDKLNDGYYSNAGNYPTRPVKPAIMSRKAGDLSLAELESLPKIIAGYNDSVDVDDRSRAAYNQRRRELDIEFRVDLEEHHGTKGHAKADLLFAKAWEKGHSSGYGEVANEYDDLVELVL